MDDNSDLRFDTQDEQIAAQNAPSELEKKFKRNTRPLEVVRYVIFIAIFYAVVNM